MTESSKPNRIYRPLRVPAGDLAKQDAAAKRAKLSWNEWVLRKLQTAVATLIVLTYACSSPPGSPAQSIPEPSPIGSAGAPSSLPESSAGAAGQSDPSSPVDVLMAPCGPANCDPMPAARAGLPNKLGCYQGICTFACAPAWDAAAAYCTELGGVCSGDASGIVSCQR